MNIHLEAAAASVPRPGLFTANPSFEAQQPTGMPDFLIYMRFPQLANAIFALFCLFLPVRSQGRAVKSLPLRRQFDGTLHMH